MTIQKTQISNGTSVMSTKLDAGQVRLNTPKRVVTMHNGMMRETNFDTNLEEVIEDLHKRITELENTIYDLILLGELDEDKLKESKKTRSQDLRDDSGRENRD